MKYISEAELSELEKLTIVLAKATDELARILLLLQEKNRHQPSAQE